MGSMKEAISFRVGYKREAEYTSRTEAGNKRKKRGLKKQKRGHKKTLGGKLQEQKRKVFKLITGMKIGNRRKVKRFMRINGKQRQGQKGEVVLDEGRDIVDR